MLLRLCGFQAAMLQTPMKRMYELASSDASICSERPAVTDRVDLASHFLSVKQVIGS